MKPYPNEKWSKHETPSLPPTQSAGLLPAQPALPTAMASQYRAAAARRQAHLAWWAGDLGEPATEGGSVSISTLDVAYFLAVMLGMLAAAFALAMLLVAAGMLLSRWSDWLEKHL